LFGILNFSHCDLPFDLAQGGGELVEPFGICVLLFEIFYSLKFEHCRLKPNVPYNMLPDKTR
jgi:hypothetical protein